MWEIRHLRGRPTSSQSPSRQEDFGRGKAAMWGKACSYRNSVWEGDSGGGRDVGLRIHERP